MIEDGYIDLTSVLDALHAASQTAPNPQRLTPLVLRIANLPTLSLDLVDEAAWIGMRQQTDEGLQLSVWDSAENGLLIHATIIDNQPSLLYATTLDSAGVYIEQTTNGTLGIDLDRNKFGGAGWQAQLNQLESAKARALAELHRQPTGVSWLCENCGWPNEAEAALCEACSLPGRQPAATPSSTSGERVEWSESDPATGEAVFGRGILPEVLDAAQSELLETAIERGLKSMWRSVSKRRVCVACEAEISAEARFCELCGAAQPITCGNCAQDISAEYQFCPHCGTNVGEQR